MAEANPFYISGLQGIQTAAEEAKQANESRYNEILNRFNPLAQRTSDMLGTVPGQYQGIADLMTNLTGETRGMLDNFGQSYRQGLSDRYDQSLGSIRALGGGMAGSYLANQIASLFGQRERSELGLEDALTRSKIEAITRATQNQAQAMGQVPAATASTALSQYNVEQGPLSFMERRNDIGPTMQDASQYATAVGAGLAAPRNYATAALDPIRNTSTSSNVLDGGMRGRYNYRA